MGRANCIVVLVAPKSDGSCVPENNWDGREGAALHFSRLGGERKTAVVLGAGGHHRCQPYPTRGPRKNRTNARQLAGMGTRAIRVAKERIEGIFPDLKAKGYKITSEEDWTYNCFAWSFEDDTRRWEPD